jgi:hypothetical protein
MRTLAEFHNWEKMQVFTSKDLTFPVRISSSASVHRDKTPGRAKCREWLRKAGSRSPCAFGIDHPAGCRRTVVSSDNFLIPENFSLMPLCESLRKLEFPGSFP